ncbi:MAG: hypothetical protein A2X49_10855 [Lentisphaerae bacterium GWF2_52_8]|nr:MAG: hypothetical protein A2X49_10855 [Lentisphaerae bacterium GWF2_52_8]
MKTSNAKTIALDVGCVCVKLQHQLCLQRLGLSSMSDIPQDFLFACNQLERGKISEEQWLALFQDKMPGWSAEDLLDAWNLIIGPDMDGMADFAEYALARGCRLVYFSDTSKLHMLRFCRNLSFAPLITGGIFSFEVGAQKPEKEMYEAFERSYGIPCLYLDDKPGNIAAGVSRGWNSHVFANASQACELLESVLPGN